MSDNSQSGEDLGSQDIWSEEEVASSDNSIHDFVEDDQEQPDDPWTLCPYHNRMLDILSFMLTHSHPKDGCKIDQNRKDEEIDGDPVGNSLKFPNAEDRD